MRRGWGMQGSISNVPGGMFYVPQMVRDGSRAKLLNGKGVGWLGNAQPASNVEYAGVSSPASPSSLESAGMHPRSGGGTARVRWSLAVGCAMDVRNVAWVMSGQCLTSLGTCLGV